MAMASLPTRQLHFAATQYISFLIIWIGLFCFVKINAVGDLVEVLGNGGGQKQREFDYFKLSLLWPGTSCRTTSRCSSNGCCRGSDTPAEFTIHGLWGDYNDGTWPACCTGKPFDIKKISTLLGTMNKYWPTLNCDSISNCYGGKGLFWEHEWEKHGTCTARVTGGEYSYFLTTLNLYFKHNVSEVMRKAGYVASNSEKYPLGGIISAIQNAFHATPELVCSGDAVDELRLCFSKNLKLQDCKVESNRGSRVVKSETSCPRYVCLPDYVPLNHTNKGTEVLQSTFVSALRYLTDLLAIG